MAISTIDALREVLAQTRLLAPEDFAALAARADTNDPRAATKALVARGALTRWQAEQLWAGRRQFLLGKYRLLDKLGSGGMGAVYLARQTGTGRAVAIKVMSKKLVENPDSVARFQREVQSAAALNHPNIVSAYDAGEADGSHYLVMEHVPGRDLSEWLKSHGRLPIDWACECIRQAALGLQHAHERGLVHRDIKPGNLLVIGEQTDSAPRVKILDMGLARLASEQGVVGELTETGQILGTPDYIAPEQAKSTKTADIRADIFSLGCTLFKLLTGTVPFGGETLMEKLMARASEDAPLASSLRPEIPPELDAVIARMLARQPAKRFQTPREAALALAPFAWGRENAADTASYATDAKALRGPPADSAESSSELRNFLGNLDAPETTGAEDSPVGLTAAPKGGVALAAVRTRTEARVETRTAPAAQALIEPVVARRFELAHAPAARRAPSTTAWAVGAAGLTLVLGVAVWTVLPGDRPLAEKSPEKRPAASATRPAPTASVTPAVSGPSGTTRPQAPPPAPDKPASDPRGEKHAIEKHAGERSADPPPKFPAPQVAPGKFGQAMQFAGREALAVAHRPELEPAEFTLEVWAKPDLIAGGKEPRQWLVNKSPNEHAPGYYALLIDGDRVSALVNVGGGSEGVVRVRSDAGVVKAGRWQHLAMTCSKSALTVWCDGRQVGVQPLARPRPAGGATPLVIGSRADEYGQFRGVLDEVRMYGRVMPAEVLRQNALAEDIGSWRAGEALGGLVECWSFD